MFQMYEENWRWQHKPDLCPKTQFKLANAALRRTRQGIY